MSYGRQWRIGDRGYSAPHGQPRSARAVQLRSPRCRSPGPRPPRRTVTAPGPVGAPPSVPETRGYPSCLASNAGADEIAPTSATINPAPRMKSIWIANSAVTSGTNTTPHRYPRPQPKFCAVHYKRFAHYDAHSTGSADAISARIGAIPSNGGDADPSPLSIVSATTGSSAWSPGYRRRFWCCIRYLRYNLPPTSWYHRSRYRWDKYSRHR